MLEINLLVTPKMYTQVVFHSSAAKNLKKKDNIKSRILSKFFTSKKENMHTILSSFISSILFSCVSSNQIQKKNWGWKFTLLHAREGKQLVQESLTTKHLQVTHHLAACWLLRRYNKPNTISQRVWGWKVFLSAHHNTRGRHLRWHS